MVPKENENNAYAKFGGTDKKYYGIFRSGLCYSYGQKAQKKQRAKWPNSFINIAGAAADIKTASSNGSYSIGGTYLLDARISVQKLR